MQLPPISPSPFLCKLAIHRGRQRRRRMKRRRRRGRRVEEAQCTPLPPLLSSINRNVGLEKEGRRAQKHTLRRGAGPSKINSEKLHFKSYIKTMDSDGFGARSAQGALWGRFRPERDLAQKKPFGRGAGPLEKLTAKNCTLKVI